MYCPSLLHSDLFHISPSNYYFQIIAQISSDQKYPIIHLTYSSPDIYGIYKMHKVNFLRRKTLLPGFFKISTDFSTTQRVKCLIYIHWIESKDSLQLGTQGSPYINSHTYFPKLFSSWSSIPPCLSQAECHYSLHSYRGITTDLSLKDPSRCSATWSVESLAIQLTSHLTSWEWYSHLSTFILLFLHLDYGSLVFYQLS